MGFSREVTELALANLDYPSVEAATDWVLSHPEEIKKLEEEQIWNQLNKDIEGKAEEKKPGPATELVIGKKQVGTLTQEAFMEQLGIIQWELAKFLFLNTFNLRRFSRQIWEFIDKTVENQNSETQTKIITELFGCLGVLLKKTAEEACPKIKIKLGKVNCEMNFLEVPDVNLTQENKVESLNLILGFILKTIGLETKRWFLNFL